MSTALPADIAKELDQLFGPEPCKPAPIPPQHPTPPPPETAVPEPIVPMRTADEIMAAYAARDQTEDPLDGIVGPQVPGAVIYTAAPAHAKYIERATAPADPPGDAEGVSPEVTELRGIRAELVALNAMIATAINKLPSPRKR